MTDDIRPGGNGASGRDDVVERPRATDRAAAERWREVEAIFAEALGLPPVDRGPHLDRACKGDPELRREVDELLEAHRTPGVFDGIVGGRDERGPGAVDDLRGRRLGPYEIQEMLGEGGMGVVYLARRADGQFDLEVALKVLPPGMASPRLRQRFLAERQILARLSHPNVARLLDGGVDEQGRPFFAMERVQGRPILEYCDEEGLGIDDRLDLFLTVCDAVQHAHQNLVVHRDLKPGNILVDDGGRPKLLDFGIAKLLDPAADGPASESTEVGVRVLTPSYAAPEQLRGEPANTATDIFQLGILLYELLTGVHPFAGDGGPAGSADASTRSDAPPRPPSTTYQPTGPAAASERARRRGSSLDGMRRRLKGDLDAITLKALRPEAEKRYRSATELAEDVRRHRARRPVRARPDTWSYRTGRFVRRNAVALTLAASAVIGISAFTAGIAREARRTERQRDRAEAVTRFMSDLFSNASPFAADGEDLTVRSLLDDGAARARATLLDEPLTQAALLEVIGDAYWELGFTEEGLSLRRDALEIRRRGATAAQDAEWTRALARVGQYRLRMGQLEAGRSQLEEAEVALARLPADAWTDRAEASNDLGLGWQALGEYDRAEPFLEEAVRGFRASPGRASATAAAMGNLAWLRMERSDPDSAMALFQEALRLRRATLGPDHPLVANTLMGLGNLQIREGDVASADSAFREALRIRREILPEDHSLIADAVLGLARATARQDRPVEADSLFLLAIQGLERSYGADHFIVGNARNDRAIFLRDQGRTAEAVEEFARSERLYRKAFGEGHLNPSLVGANLAWAYFLDGRPEEAVSWFERVVPHILAADSAGARFRSRQVDYAIALCRTEGADSAVAVFEDALAAFAAYAPEDDQRLRTANALGECLGLLGRYSEAEGALRDVLDRTSGRPDDDPYRAFARRVLERVYEAWGRPEDARRVASGG